MYRNKKLLEGARGEECTMHSKVCNYNPETTVAAHSPFMSGGRGMGLKSSDCFVAYLCSACHDLVDGRNNVDKLSWEWRETLFYRAMMKTWERILEKGILK